MAQVCVESHTRKGNIRVKGYCYDKTGKIVGVSSTGRQRKILPSERFQAISGDPDTRKFLKTAAKNRKFSKKVREHERLTSEFNRPMSATAFIGNTDTNAPEWVYRTRTNQPYAFGLNVTEKRLLPSISRLNKRGRRRRR